MAFSQGMTGHVQKWGKMSRWILRACFTQGFFSYLYEPKIRGKGQSLYEIKAGTGRRGPRLGPSPSWNSAGEAEQIKPMICVFQGFRVYFSCPLGEGSEELWSNSSRTVKKHLIPPTYGIRCYCEFQTEEATKQIRGYLLYVQLPAVLIWRHLWGGTHRGFYFEQKPCGNMQFLFKKNNLKYFNKTQSCQLSLVKDLGKQIKF